MKLAADGVNKVIYKIYKKKHPLLAQIMLNWPKIVGINYNNCSSPLKIISTWEKKKKSNILFVEVDNSSVSVEISFQQDIIIERIAIYMGYKAINKIRTVVTYTSS